MERAGQVQTMTVKARLQLEASNHAIEGLVDRFPASVEDGIETHHGEMRTGDSDNSIHRMENAAKLSPDVESLSAKHASTRELMEGGKSRSAAKDNEGDDDEGPDLSLDNDNSRPIPGRREWSSKAEARQRSKEVREKKRKARLAISGGVGSSSAQLSFWSPADNF